MDRLDRQSRIIEYLKIKPTHHGQLETCLLAIPDGISLKFPPERLEEIRTSLTEQGTNLIPLMVRRSDAYGDDFEYEVIYGEEWCVVAQELGIDRLWVWMFDLDDEQAQVARAEMARLAGAEVVIVPGPGPIQPTPDPLIDPSIARHMEDQLQKIQELSKQVERVETALKTEPKKTDPTEVVVPQLEKFEERFSHLESAIQELGDREAPQPTVTKVDSQPLAEVLNRALDAIAAGQIRVNLSIESGKVITPPPLPIKEPSTVAELRAELQARGIAFSKSAKKPELLTLWEKCKSSGASDA
ncbi:MAG: HeH/LEM domain-containing protein [Cyanobacteria bacterium]|nr:HeH/LEM domain-containing protein [Cyanobacteriota bacterium]